MAEIPNGYVETGVFIGRVDVLDPPKTFAVVKPDRMRRLLIVDSPQLTRLNCGVLDYPSFAGKPGTDARFVLYAQKDERSMIKEPQIKMGTRNVLRGLPTAKRAMVFFTPKELSRADLYHGLEAIGQVVFDTADDYVVDANGFYIWTPRSDDLVKNDWVWITPQQVLFF